MTISIKGLIPQQGDAMDYIFEDLAFIDGAGQYHAGTTLLAFPAYALTDEQWANMDKLSEGERQDYALAIIHDDRATIKAIEEDAGIE